MKKAARWIGNILVAVVMLLAVLVILAPRFGWQVSMVYSGSMEPALDVGGVAVVRPVDPQAIKAGDVISYAPPTDTSIRVTHRVIEVVQGGDSLMFRTKGDANEDPDAYAVPAQNVVGRVWICVPYLGYLIDYIRTPLGFGLLIGIPAALLILIELKSIFSLVRGSRQKGFI